MRIAMLGHKRIPSREGGVEIVVEELSSRMVDLGHDVTCYNRKGHHVSGKKFDTKELGEHKGIKLKSVFTVEKKGLAAMTASFSASIYAAFGKYDVVHFHSEGPCAMLWLPKLFGKRCVATIHGLDHQRAKWGNFASKYILFGEKCAVKFADEIIVLSENTKKYFKDTYNRETVYIPNGVCRAEKVPAEEITKLYGLEDNSYILYLGRLVPEKGIAYLIDAYKCLETTKKLVIAGGSSDSTEFAEELKKSAGENSNIIFTDFVQGKVLEELYSNAYMYVLPSDLEGMPLSLLEAMSYGNCCVTSDIPECVNITGDCGVAFKKGDSVALAEKIKLLLKEKDTTEKLRNSSADYVCEKFNWEKIVEKTLKLYEK